MVSYRTKIEIVGDILTSAHENTIEQDGASIMQIIRHANIPHGRLSQGLLEQVDSQRACKYKISGIGKDFLIEYKKFNKFTSDFGLTI